MPKFELVMRNSLGCEIGRQPILDSDGVDGPEPEILSTFNTDSDLRQMLHVMVPGDTLELVEFA